MNNTTDIIKDKLNIVDVVGSYVKLEKAGKTYKGKSPFTNEKTPSFFVSPEKGFFYCFSSGKGGDIFNFIQEIERVDFREALKILAEKAGVDLQNTERNQQQSTIEHRYYKALDDATKWYEVQLRKNPEAVEYLTKRGLTKETIVKFRIGFAHNRWRDIYEYLKSKKYSDEEINAVGLVTKKEGSGYYDRFRSRIMFPIMDGRGRVVGFSGRIFNEDQLEQPGAKYVNSPETVLFDKSKVLYGYHTAKHAMSKTGVCIFVEGQFDVLMAQQSGYEHTVAISGTGLTDGHITMIKRFTSSVILALDSDNAGIKATRRSVLTAYRHGLEVKVVLLPDGKDPADVIASSKEKWDLAVRESQDYLDYRLETIDRQNLDFKAKKDLIETDIFTFVYLTQSAMVQDKMLQKIALFLGVTIEAVRSDFARYTPETLDTNDAPESSVEVADTDTIEIIPDAVLIWNYITDKGIMINPEIISKAESLHQDVYGMPLDEHVQGIDPTIRNMQVFAYEMQHPEPSVNFLEQSLIESLVHQRILNINEESREILSQIRQAEGRKDGQAVITLMRKNQELLLLKTELEQNR